jgi:hypothetical protein
MRRKQPSCARVALLSFLLILCLLAGAYLLYRLTKIREMDFALRYAIPTVIIVWSCIETIQKWRALP